MNEKIVEQIAAELDRLEVGEGWAGRQQMAGAGISVYADADLPRGWVRFEDSAGAPSYAPAEAVLACLQAVTDEEREADDCAESVWDAINEPAGGDKSDN